MIASSRTFLDESLAASVQQLVIPPGVNAAEQLANPNGTAVEGFLARPTGWQRWRFTQYPPQSSYTTLLHQIEDPTEYEHLWQRDGELLDNVSSAVRDNGGVLAPIETSNPTSVWDAGDNEFEYQLLAPPGNADTQFQKLASHQGNGAFNFTTRTSGWVTPKIIGEFDPDKLPGFNPLSAVPLETYYPPVVTGADAASRKALKNQPLGPTMNLGGYVAQPPLLLTSLTAMEQMLSQSCYIVANKEVPSCTRYSDTDIAAPISAIRVRVANVHSFGPIDRARILAVATAIKKDTGLQVDITAGSSPTTVNVDLPAGCCGEPALDGG